MKATFPVAIVVFFSGFSLPPRVFCLQIPVPKGQQVAAPSHGGVGPSIGFDLAHAKKAEVSADVPEPQPGDWYQPLHEKYKAQAEHAKDVDVLYLGDSILETMMGYMKGERKGMFDGNLEVYKNMVRSTGPSLNFGMGQDKVRHVMWRLLNDELPDAMQPKVIFLHIGLNDMMKMEDKDKDGFFEMLRFDSEFVQVSRLNAATHGITAEEIPSLKKVGASFRELLRFLRAKRPRARILVSGVYAPQMFIDYKIAYKNVFDHFNTGLRRLITEEFADHSAVKFVDCYKNMGSQKDGIADKKNLVDGVHPSKTGAKLLFECVTPLIQKALNEPL